MANPLERFTTAAKLRGQNAPNVLPPGAGQVVEEWLGNGGGIEEPMRNYGATARPPMQQPQAPMEPMRPQVPPGYMGEDPFLYSAQRESMGDRVRSMRGQPQPDPTVKQRAAQAYGRTGSYDAALKSLQGPDQSVPWQSRLDAAWQRGNAHAGLDPFEWTGGVAHDPTQGIADNARYWEGVKKAQGPYGGNVTPYWKPTPSVAMSSGVDPMAAAMSGGKAATAAAAGGRAAGVARGALGMLGGPVGLGVWGAINNAVDLSNPNSVMRKAIHEGSYGTALARGAANFIPGAGTIWDNLVSNDHPEQPTVNKPQATDPETPLDLTDAFPGDPLKHGNYTSRHEMQENYKLQKMFEPKPQVEAAQNQMQMLDRDLQAAMKTKDKARIDAAWKARNDFERLLALGQNSYPYMTASLPSLSHEWIGEGY